MAKKLCELCQQNYESDMRFGVRLCQKCLDGYSAAMKGELDAVTEFSDPKNFPQATDQAKTNIIYAIAKRYRQIEYIKQENQQKKEIEKKQRQREAYAKTVGVTYKERIDNTDAMVDSWYADIGKKIKGWARWIFVVEAIAAIIGAVIMMCMAENGMMFFTALLVLVLGPVLAWVSSWLLYAFGELVEKTAANEQNTRNILKVMLENNAQKDKD